MREIDIQAKLIDDYLDAYKGGIGYKQSNMFRAGVPDLRLAHLRTGEWNIEVKYLDRLPNTASVMLELTELQRRWGRLAGRNGLNWGWCLVVRDENRGYWVTAGADYNQREVEMPMIKSGNYKGRGNKWTDYDPIKQIKLSRGIEYKEHPAK